MKPVGRSDFGGEFITGSQPKQSLIDLNQDHLNQDGLKGISTVKQSSIKAVAAKINRLLLVTLSFFLVTNCTPTFSTKSADRTQVSINLSHLHSGPGIKVDYQFSHPVTEFLFEVPAPRIRGANWVLKTPDTIFTEQSAVSAQPTRRLVFEIHPDQTVLDSMDPGMYVLDNGIVFDLDYLPGAKALYETSLIINAPGSTFISTSHDVALSTELFKIVNPFGLAYLGDSEPVERNAVIIVAEQEFPGQFIAGIDRLLDDTTRHYSRLLPSAVYQEPRLILSLDQQESLGFRGIVNENIIALHLQGDEWLDLDPHALGQLSSYVRHEIFHMFSGQLHVEKDDQHRSAWLTEGAAEYFGGALDSKRRNAAGEPIQELFNQCLSATGSQPVNSQGHSAISHATYRCGEFLIGALSLMLGDSHSVSSVWLEMLQPDSLNGTAFSTDEIFDIVQRLGIVHFESIADLTLNQEGLARWQKIQSEMAGTGADVEFTYIQAVRAEGTRLIRQLLTRHCRGASGFKSDESLLTLYTPNCSGGFKDSAEVVQIESHPIRNVGAWVNSIVDRCSRAESIMFTLKDGDEMPIHCE